MAEQKAKTADRKKVQVVQEIPCQRCGKPTRVGFKFVGEGADRKRVRFAKRSGVEIDG